MRTPRRARGRELSGMLVGWHVACFLAIAGEPVKAAGGSAEYREAAPWSLGMRSPQCLVVLSNDHVYVAGENVLGEWDGGGRKQGAWTLPGEVRCMAPVPEGGWALGIRDHVEWADIAGGVTSQWAALDGDSWITALAVVPSDVFVADAGKRVVLRYGRDGILKGRIGLPDKERNIPGFVIPSPYFHLQMGRDGLLRVANPGRHRVEAYTASGDLESVWGEQAPALGGFFGCCNPAFFVLLEDGGFVTSEKGWRRIKRFDPEGRYLGLVRDFSERDGAEESGPHADGADGCQPGGGDPLPVAVDRRGRILVLDGGAGVIRVFEPVGKGGT